MKVRVSAIAAAGFFRAGLFWPQEGRIVDPDELGDDWERLAAEPNLRISPVSADELTGDPTAEEVRDLVIEAIRALPGDAFGKDGKPKMDPLREAVGPWGKLVSTEMRDAIWEDLKPAAPDA